MPSFPQPAHIESASLNAWPALQTNVYDGWLLRFADGYTKRANSVTPLYPGSIPHAEKIDHCEAIYRGQNQTPIFRLPSFHPETDAIDQLLIARGYGQLDVTSVQSLNIEGTDETVSERVYDMLRPTDWLSTYQRLSPPKYDTHQQILENVIGKTAYFVLMADGQSVACGLAVREGELVGLFDILVDPEHRRKGYGLEVVNSLIAWGAGNGAKIAYLQVVADNAAAVNLYARLGFRELYRYWYRTYL